MSQNIFMLGFADEMVKLAQLGPRPAPGTRMPPKVPQRHTAPGPKKFAPPKPQGPRAEGYVKGMTVSGLPRSMMKGSPKGIVSAVGERKKWEASVKKEKSKLPGWLSDSMKRPVKNHPMASPEAVARSKREDADAKKMVAGILPKKPDVKRVRRRKKPSGPVQYGSMGGKTVKGGGTTGPTGLFAPHRKSLYPSGGTDPYRKLPGGGYRKALVRKPMTVPGYRAMAKKRTI